MKILITESQYRRLLNKKYLKEQRVADLGPKKTTNTSGSPSFLQQPNASALIGTPTTNFLKNKFGGESTTFREPLGNPKKNVNVNGKIIPAQNDTHYWDGSTWVEKSVQNVDKWRSVPSGFAPAEYNEYLTKLAEINKIYSKVTSLNSAESTGVNLKPIANLKRNGVTKIRPFDAKSDAIEELNSIYYNKKYPLGLTNTQKKELLSKLDATNKYYDDQLKSLYGDPRINRGDYFATMHSQQIKGREIDIQSQKESALKSITSQYNYWYDKKEAEEFDWITVIGFAMYLCPYTAPFAPYVSAAQRLYKAAKAYDSGDMRTAALETLFVLLPFGKFGKTLKTANLMNAVDKLVLGKSLETAEINVLKQLTSNSSVIKSELKAGADALLKQVPESAKKEAVKWTDTLINKAYSEAQGQLNGYNALKDKLKEEGKKQDLKSKLAQK